MSGSQYSPMASLLGDLGRSATPWQRASKTDSGGEDQSSAKMKPPPSERYDRKDPATDAQAQRMVEEAKSGGEARS